jgi:carboxyl-terminal processing protease
VPAALSKLMLSIETDTNPSAGPLSHREFKKRRHRMSFTATFPFIQLGGIAKGLALLYFSLAAMPVTAIAPEVKSNIPVDTLLQLIKSQSVHGGLVQWDELEPTIKAQLNKASTDNETLGVFVDLFRQMNDVHSAIYYNNRQFGYYKGVDEQTARLLRPLINLQKAQSGIVKASLQANKYGYVLIPTIHAAGSDQINQYAQRIQDEICRIGTDKPRGWIIDLRLNGGGNMLPMLAGLSNLLGNGVVGGSVDANDTLIRKWSLNHGDLYLDEGQATAIRNRCVASYAQAPVVVLIGPVTISSGAATAIAFKHRANTYFIGEPTAEGYTTANDYIWINEGLALNLATSYMADRIRVPYKSQVLPDLSITGGDSFENLAEDLKIKAALKWLNEKRSATPEDA